MITDFATGPGGDILNVTSTDYTYTLLNFPQGANPFAERYYRLLQSGPDTLLQADKDGPNGSANFVNVVILKNTNAADFTSDNFLAPWNFDPHPPQGITVDDNDSGNVLPNSVGPDTLLGNGGADTIFGADGSDSISGGDANDSLGGDDGHDTITGDAGDDTILGGAGENLLFGGDGDDSITSGDDANKIFGDAGHDTVQSGAGKDTLDGGTGNDLLIAGANSDSILGGDGQDSLFGEDDNDIIKGGAGDDCIDGGASWDILIGGPGNDTISGGSPDNVFVDEARYSGVQADYTIISNPDGSYTIQDLRPGSPEGTDIITDIERLTFFAGGVLDLAGTLNQPGDSLSGTSGDDFLHGTAGMDTINGGAGNDSLESYEGPDSLTGGTGNDCLFGGDGLDTLVGGSGNDTYYINFDAGDLLIEGANGGIDTVHTFTSVFTLPANFENLTRDLESAGSDDFLGTGNVLDNFLEGSESTNDTLYGLGGNDTLYGRGGADSLDGGNGDDNYLEYDSASAIFETPNGGIDVVYTTLAAYTVPDNVEYLAYAAARGDFAGTGNPQANSIGGGIGNDTLLGMGNNDTLIGNDGDDSLDGGSGDDSIDGSAGSDIVNYTGDRNDYTVLVTDLTVTIIDNRSSSPDGTDNVTNVETFVFADGPINAPDLAAAAPSQPKDANPAPNTVLQSAASGADVGITAFSADFNLDSVTYSLSDDAGGRFAIDPTTGLVTVANGTLLGGSQTTINHNIATDSTTRFVTVANGALLGSKVNYNITVQVSDGALTNTKTFTIAVHAGPGVTITGTSASNLIDATHSVGGQPFPTNNNDSINGGAGNDTIYGFGDNDTLDGGTGSDSLIGGADNDLYVVDSTGDKVLENPNDGTDTIQSSVTYTLSADVEALILMGIANINGTGNSANNTITGNAGNNVLAGLGGADVLDGSAGTDTAAYAASPAGVNVSLATGIGSGGQAAGDTLTNIENLTGSNFSDTLEGNGGNNVLSGGTGTDTVSYEHAGAGVTANLALTSAQYTVGAGTDTLTTFENLTGSAFNDSLTGSSASNVLMGLTGNDTLNDTGGNDTLDGGTGADSMAAGTGNDTYVVDDAGDVVNELSGGGTDTIATTLNAYSLAPLANLENLTFIGAGGFTGTGNALNNALTGGSDSDTLDGGGGNDTLDAGAGADSMIGGAGNDTFIVDDAGDTVTEGAVAGTDTVKTTLAAYTLGANLENLTFTGLGNFAGTGNTLANTITGGTGNDALDGGSGNDKLLGGASDDQLMGGAGNDTITGGTGADTMTGGIGADRFTFTAISDFATGVNLDTILDFNHAQADKIDVSVINGNASIAGSAFTFVGAAAFSNVAGQLHYVVNGSGGVNVEGDTNGDGIADFTLVVNSVPSLVAGDFVL